MADLGTDMGNAGLQVTGRVVEAILNLLARIYEDARNDFIRRNSVEGRLQREQLAKIRQDMQKARMLDRYGELSGMVCYDGLMRAKAAGLDITPLNVQCSKEQLKELASICKRNDVLISAVEDVRSRELGGEKTYTLVCRSGDVDKLSEIVDTMVDGKRIEALRAEQKALLDLGEDMSDVDKLVVQNIDKEIQFIRDKDLNKLNSLQMHGQIAKAVGAEQEVQPMPFNEAINRLTGRRIDKDVTAYIVDATNPNNYMVAQAHDAEYRGENYIKTDYTVYKDGEEVFKCDDGRFDGRDKYHWQNLREEMHEKGGFGDTVIKFYDKSEFDQYRDAFERQNASEIMPLLEATSNEDFQAACRIIESQLKECDCHLDAENKKIIDNRTGYVVTPESMFYDDVSKEECARLAEAMVCVRQLEKYAELDSLRSAIEIAYSDVLITEAGTLDHAQATANYENIKTEYDEVLAEVTEFIENRKGINSVQAKNEVDEEKNPSHERSPEVENGNTVQKTVEEWDAAVERAAEDSMDEMIGQELSLSQEKVHEEFKRADTLDENADHADTRPERMGKEAHADRVREGAGLMQDRLNSEQGKLGRKTGKSLEH